MATTAAQIASWVYVNAARFNDPVWTGRIELWCSDAIAAHTEATFGRVFVAAMGSWVLHKAVLREMEDEIAGGGFAAGPVTSLRTGDESVSFGQMASSGIGVSTPDHGLSRTIWGQDYLNYRNSRAGTHLFVI